MILNKNILSSFAGLSSINILNIIIPIITMPYLSRVLTPSGYGIFLLFSTVYIFSFIIIDYSSNITGVREIASAVNIETQQDVYSNTQSIRFIFSIVSFILSVGYIILTLKGTVNTTFIIANVFITVLGYYFTAPWYHQGKQDMLILAVSSFISRLLQIIIIFFFVKTLDDLLLAIISTSLVFFISGIIAFLYRRTRYGIHDKINIRKVVPGLRAGFNSFVGDFAPNLYSNLPPLLIGLFTAPSVFASYSLSMRIINIASSFQLMLAKAIYPSVVKGEYSLKSMSAINLISGFIPIVIIYMFGDKVIDVFLGEGYEKAAFYLKFLAPSIFFVSLLYSLTYGFFLPRKLDKEFRNISLIVSLISAVVGYVIIYKIGIIGAIVMFIMARFLFCCFYLFYYFKINKKNKT